MTDRDKNPGAGCPVCGSHRRRTLFTRHRGRQTRRTRRCSDCKHRYVTADRVLSNSA